jgi:hypothetical protein
MDAYTKQLLAKIDKLNAELNSLPLGDPRRAHLADQIEALNRAITQHGKD